MLLPTGKWSSPPTTGPRPPPCSNFSFTAINNHQAVLFGGYQPGCGQVNDCYLLNFESMVCSERCGRSLCHDKCMYVCMYCSLGKDRPLTKEHPPPTFGSISHIGSKFTQMRAHPGASFAWSLRSTASSAMHSEVRTLCNTIPKVTTWHL